MCVCVTRGTGPELVQLIKVVEEEDMGRLEKGWRGRSWKEWVIVIYFPFTRKALRYVESSKNRS